MLRAQLLLTLTIVLTLTMSCGEDEDTGGKQDIFMPAPVNIGTTTTGTGGSATSASGDDHGHAEGQDGGDQASGPHDGGPGSDGRDGEPGGNGADGNDQGPGGPGEDQGDQGDQTDQGDQGDQTDSDVVEPDAGEVCKPSCSGKACGDDGCGEPCGTCPSGFECTEKYQCSPTGSGCNAAIPIESLPYQVNSSTVGHSNATHCLDALANTAVGDTAPDSVFSFKAPKTSIYRIAITAEFTAVAHITKQCGEAAECITTTTSDALVELEAGTTYTITVDGSDSDVAGKFKLNVDSCDDPCPENQCGVGKCGLPCSCPSHLVCGADKFCTTPDKGDSCTSNPLAIPEFPAQVAGSTDMHTDAVSCSPSPGNGIDVVHVFNPPFDSHIAVGLEANYDAFAYLTTTCEQKQCGDIIQVGGTQGFSVKQNVDYFIVVESSAEDGAGTFKLNVLDCTESGCSTTCPCPINHICDTNKKCVKDENGDLCKTAPETACIGQPCNAAPCGTVCGCPSGKVCKFGVCDTPIAFDSCDSPGTIEAVPSQITGDLTPMGDSMGCGVGQGSGTSDAVYSFKAPSTGVFLVSVSGPDDPVVFRTAQCQENDQDCLQLPAKQILFTQHMGETSTLIVDSTNGVGSAYTLSISRVVGLNSSLGSACNAASDCELADHCVAGVCTLACDPSGNDLACTGAVNGPRGDVYGCAKDAKICVPGITNGDTAVCGSSTDCPKGVCAGLWAPPDNIQLQGICAPEKNLKSTGEDCSSLSDCATSMCINNTCVELCQALADCTGDKLCLLTPAGSFSAGSCQTVNTTGGACATDADCGDAAMCEGVLSYTGKPIFYCRPTDSSLGAIGAPCQSDADCQSGLCPFKGFKGFQASTCSAVCPTSVDCPTGLKCQEFTIWDSGTTNDSSDDASLPICVSGTSDSTCLLNGKSTCEQNLTCNDVFDAKYGACQ